MERVDAIYRRIDDDFVDPLVFRPDSTLGVPGLFAAYRAGKVTLANAIGTGVADDKSIYPYVPDMIRFYLTEEPILNNVPTWLLHRDDDLRYCLDHQADLVVKEVHGAGGYGMLVGPAASAAGATRFAPVLSNPAKYIAQPTLPLSTCPTFTESGLRRAHRPAAVRAVGRAVNLVPGGLTGHCARLARRQSAGRRDQGHLGDGGLGLRDAPSSSKQPGPEQAMLCRTANELYWMACHIERAENTARLLDVTYRMSLLPYDAVEPGLAWAEPWRCR